jgi:hypothetical protein
MHKTVFWKKAKTSLDEKVDAEPNSHDRTDAQISQENELKVARKRKKNAKRIPLSGKVIILSNTLDPQGEKDPGLLSDLLKWLDSQNGAKITEDWDYWQSDSNSQLVFLNALKHFYHRKRHLNQEANIKTQRIRKPSNKLSKIKATIEEEGYMPKTPINEWSKSVWTATIIRVGSLCQQTEIDEKVCHSLISFSHLAKKTQKQRSSR